MDLLLPFILANVIKNCPPARCNGLPIHRIGGGSRTARHCDRKLEITDYKDGYVTLDYDSSKRIEVLEAEEDGTIVNEINYYEYKPEIFLPASPHVFLTVICDENKREHDQWIMFIQNH